MMWLAFLAQGAGQVRSVRKAEGRTSPQISNSKDEQSATPLWAAVRTSHPTRAAQGKLNRTGGMYEPAAVAPGDRGTGHP